MITNDPSHIKLPGYALAVSMAAVLLLQGCATIGNSPVATKDAVTNFGFPTGFSVTKMDTDVSPRTDFKRYAAGRWLDAATIPGDSLRVSSYQPLIKQVENQLQTILADAAKNSATAVKGSPLQQAGDFYASGIDEQRLTALGASPIEPELKKIDAIKNPKALAETLAHLMEITGQPVLFGLLPETDTQDRTKYALYATDGILTLDRDYYLKPEAAPIREAYLKLITTYLTLAGNSPAEAKVIADKILEMETRIAGKKLTPVEMQDPAKRFVKMPFSELKSLLSNVDMDAYTKALALPPQEQVIVMGIEALRERNQMLAEYPLGVTRNYLRWELVRLTASYLSPAFLEPSMVFSRSMYGKIDTPPRIKLVTDNTAKQLGHPLSQLYVANHFPPETKKNVEDLIGRIKAEFRGRLEHNSWLSEETRRQALAKLEKLEISVGYPAEWIDYSSVDIKRDDYLGNVLRLNTFSTRREMAKLGKPVKKDTFASAGHTLPITINAAYNPGENSIQIPAAFLQPPFYDAASGIAVNYCTTGAVIGHEITHGFDSTGRLYDADGNIRNWWTEADGKNFEAEAQKLVAQGNKYEVLPGLHMNGALTVGENLADTGGVSFGYSALKGYLKEHPEAVKVIDGLTLEQRCFLAWGQLWSDKTNEGYLKQVTATDPHPPGVYRMTAPSQHEKGFYETFGIKPGDPMWLDEKDRVRIW